MCISLSWLWSTSWQIICAYYLIALGWFITCKANNWHSQAYLLLRPSKLLSKANKALQSIVKAWLGL